MLRFLRGRASDRKLQLFAVACCRRIWHRVPDPRSRQAIETTEHFIEGAARVEEMEAARQEAEAAQLAAGQHGRWDAGEYATVALSLAPEWNPESWPCVHSVVYQAAHAAAQCAELSGKNRKSRKFFFVRRLTDENGAQCLLLRDILGNPFRPAPIIEPAVLAWNERTVVRLARRAYEERSLPGGTLDDARLAVLADALEEAGFSDVEMLAHLRGPGPHVRGCWPVDCCLGQS
jgi:hypothetical protein